ncbi:MAG: 16S rRNA (guanine(527)-N(7))-methyltransferase RsmG [Prochlorococcus sp.]
MPAQVSDETPEAHLWRRLGWQPSTDQLNQLKTLQELLRHWNAQTNLTRLVEGDDYWISQIYDSLWPLRRELADPDQPRNCIDVGTGGGFPGLAAAIAMPAAKLTLVDSVKRKTNAVAAMATELGLASRVTVRTERVEQTGQDERFRGRFDLAMARAVAAAPVVAEYLIPLLNPSGEALLFRGLWCPTDEQELCSAITPLNAVLCDVERMDLPADRGVRHLVRLKPKSTCPALFPRPVGIPAKSPLGSQALESRC